MRFRLLSVRVHGSEVSFPRYLQQGALKSWTTIPIRGIRVKLGLNLG